MNGLETKGKHRTRAADMEKVLWDFCLQQFVGSLTFAAGMSQRVQCECHHCRMCPAGIGRVKCLCPTGTRVRKCLAAVGDRCLGGGDT